MTKKFLYFCGLLIPFTYMFLYLLGGYLRPGYNQISDSVSELLTPGAPNKSLLLIIQIAYASLYILFGVGVLLFVRLSPNNTLPGRIGAWLIVALGLVTIGTAIFPQDATGASVTMPGQIHKILVFGGLIPLSIFSTLLIGYWSGQAGVFPGFNIYSYITVVAIVIMGGVGGATVETQYAGIVERISAIVTQQWLFVLALMLLLNSRD